jgi:hypothetical protein
MIEPFLRDGHLCSLDIPITHVEEFNDGPLCDYRNFIPQIRVSIPYTKLWNYNTMLKIDDKDFDATNPGVWCHSLHSLMSRQAEEHLLHGMTTGFGLTYSTMTEMWNLYNSSDGSKNCILATKVYCR